MQCSSVAPLFLECTKLELKEIYFLSLHALKLHCRQPIAVAAQHSLETTSATGTTHVADPTSSQTFVQSGTGDSTSCAANTFGGTKCQMQGCEFFGTAKTHYYCSKCFNDNTEMILKELNASHSVSAPFMNMTEFETVGNNQLNTLSDPTVPASSSAYTELQRNFQPQQQCTQYQDWQPSLASVYNQARKCANTSCNNKASKDSNFCAACKPGSWIQESPNSANTTILRLVT